MLTAKFLLIPAVGLLAFVFGTSKPAAAKPGAPKPGADTVPPPDVMAKIAAAFQAADPAQLRKLADEVEGLGFKAQADDLRAFAAKVEAAIKSNPTPPAKPPAVATVPPSAGPVPAPAAAVPPLTTVQPSPGGGIVTTLPEMVITSEGPSQNQRLLAGKMALMLRNASKGSEDQGLVQAFQEQELAANHGPGGAFGTTPSKADGMYGPKVALQLARHYAIVPPRPFYWAKNTWLTDKKNYRAEMARYASVDPQRADEWSAAGKVL